MSQSNKQEVKTTEPEHSVRAIRDIKHSHNCAALVTVMKGDSKNPDDYPEEYKQIVKRTDDILAAYEANDPTKTMLALQMQSVNDLLIKSAMLTRNLYTDDARQIQINNVVKLSNLFIQQANLMHKLQGKGQQKVTVEHVHVHDGGQAIVGNVEGGGR